VLFWKRYRCSCVNLGFQLAWIEKCLIDELSTYLGVSVTAFPETDGEGSDIMNELILDGSVT
jgi:hypothetical protein